MNDRRQIMGTYKSISDWHHFRLRLFLEGILTGIFAGLVISLFRWGLTVAEEWRVEFYHELVERDWSSTAMWFVALLFIGVVLYKLTRFEPMAAGSGIPQVKGSFGSH